MKIKPNGKYEWQGVFLPEEDSDEEEQSSFVIFADNIQDALKHALEDIPGVVVYLARGEDVSDMEHELSDEAVAKLEEARKRSLN